MSTDWTLLANTMDELEQHADIGVSVIAPDGDNWNRKGDVQFPSASTVKIPIMIQIYRMIDKGELALDDTHILKSSEKSNGSGVLRHMHSGLIFSLGDLLYLMMSISDNTATNILIDLAGMDNVNAVMHELGMTQSILGRPMRGRLALPGEQENLATPNDYSCVVQAIINGSAASSAACTAMLATLEKQQNKRRIGRYVPTDDTYRWGSKTGTNNGIVNDVGFVSSPDGTMIIAVYCRSVADEVSGEQFIADITRYALQATGIID